MTNRKCCGSCRFFEVGTVQGHGLCRNPDYQGRDESVLLRAEELACRTGWQKDFWQLSEDSHALGEAMTRPGLSADQGGSLPIGQGIAAFIATEGADSAKGASVASRPAASAFPAGRRRNGPPGASTLATVPPPRSSQGGVSTIAASLQGHPELGENGEVIRRPNRTMVAEAHRKALERREAERMMALTRRQEEQHAALATMSDSSKPTAGSADATGAGGASDAPPRAREAAAVPPAKPSAPIATSSPFGLAGAPLPVEDRPTVSAPLQPEADDRPLAVGHQAPASVSTSKPLREEVRSLPITVPVSVELPAATAGLPVRRVLEPVAAGSREALGTSNGPRYWDEPGANNRFLRMRQEVPDLPPSRPDVHEAPTMQSRLDVHEAPTMQTPVPNVGRQRAETPPASEPTPSGRTIRSLKPLATTMPVEPDEVPIASSTPARIPRPAAPVAETRPVEPKVPAMPPRQIDAQLVKELQRDWRERALAAHSGQRCGTCRFFQATESAERGSCGCPLAESYRHALGRQDLGCLNSFGTWWAADDAGWLQKTELGPRRPTPLLDQLLWEKGMADNVPVVEERRRSAQ